MAQPTVEINFLSEFKELFNEDWRNIVFYGGRGSGKSWHVGLALILRGRQKKHLILCTRELQNTIADSVHALLTKIIETHGFTDYEITDKEIRNRITGTKFIFKGLRHNATEIKSTEGISISWVEEAQSISDDSLKILAPTVRDTGSQLIFTFNRFLELDPVYVRYVLKNPPKTYSRQVNYDVLERAGLLPEGLKLELEADRHDPETFEHVWMGEPLSQAEKAILNRRQIRAAMERMIEDDGQVEIGVDVARMGDDRTVFWKRKGLKTLEYKVYQHLRTTEVCDRLEQFADFNHETLIKVDDTGVGGGVTDELMRREYNVLPINFGGEAGDKDKYPNWISEAWFYFGSILDQAQLPFNSDLLMELSSRQWAQDAKGKRRVEGKADYKKRGFRSPDLADACIICYATPNLITMDDIAM